MDEPREFEEKTREAACNGDLRALQDLIEIHKIDVNSKNKMNGW